MQVLKEQPEFHRVDVDAILERYPDLARYADEECRAMLARASVVTFPRKSLLFSEAHVCQNFMLLLNGSVRVFKQSKEGREVTIYRVAPGELCMLSLNSLMSQNPYPASAMSEDSITALSISSCEFNQAIRDSDGFRSYVLTSLTQRLSDVISLVTDITFHRLDIRLACLLGTLFERSRGDSLAITHAELARELGTTREVISRMLKEFEVQNCIKLGRGHIHLNSQEGIAWFANDRPGPDDKPALSDKQQSH